MNDHNLEQDIKINKFQLPDECEKQASLYYYWAEQAAKAKKEVNEASDSLKLIKADQQKAIRIRLDREGTKVTEAVVQAEIDTDRKVLDAQKQLREKEGNLYLLEAAVTALEHRRSSLNNLTTLSNNQWFAAPTGQRQTPIEQSANTLRGKERRTE